MGGHCSQKLLPRRGLLLLSGAQPIFGSIRDQQLYRKDRMPAARLSGVLFFPRQRQERQ